MDLSSFLTSLVTSFLVFLVLAVGFTWSSRYQGNAVVYFSGLILRGMEDEAGVTRRRRGGNPFRWAVETVRLSDAQVVLWAGMDAAVYLDFLYTAFRVFVLCGVVLLPLLLPVARTDNNLDDVQRSSRINTTVPFEFNVIDQFSMGNVKEESKRLWAFLLGAYWVTFVTIHLSRKAYEQVSDLRAAAKSRPEAKPEDYTVLVRDIPPVPEGRTRQEQVDSYFRAFCPDAFYRSMVITDNTLVEKIWKELGRYRKKLAHAEAGGRRPRSRIGFLGLVGEKVDTIRYCEEKIHELSSLLENEKETTISEKQQSAALVFLNRREAAISAAQAIHGQIANRWTVEEAPEPRQLLWKNLHRTFYARQRRKAAVSAVVFLTVVFYMVPITFISAFTTLRC